MNRGIDHARIFDDVASDIFLLELGAACEQRRIQVHGYCVLPNHYHLLLYTPEAGLSAAMQRLSSRFTQAVNKCRERDGPLFRGRFRSVAIADDAHLAKVSQYIHYNPVEARLVMGAEQWKWSSAAAYLGLADKPDWLHIGTILEMFGPTNPEGRLRPILARRGEAAVTGSAPSPRPINPISATARGV